MTAWAAQAFEHRAAAAAKTQLRGALLARVVALGPAWRRAGGSGGNGDPGYDGRADGAGSRGAAALTQLATTGLEGLGGYFTGDYRRATMATLRLAFLSSFALELIATMSLSGSPGTTPPSGCSRNAGCAPTTPW